MKTKRLVPHLFLFFFVLATAHPGLASGDGEKDKRSAPTDDIPELTDFASLQKVFNQDKSSVRLVALLSPSCGYCIKGCRYMRKILDEVQDERLKMYVVWEPMLSGDSQKLAERMSRKAEDPRLVFQAWDQERVTGKIWQDAMHLGGIAWDVYFLYGAGVEWGDNGPSQPDYWQQQGLGGQENWLNYDKLKAKVEEMLAQAG